MLRRLSTQTPWPNSKRLWDYKDSYKLFQLTKGHQKVDLEVVAQNHFPEHDVLDVMFQYEFNIKDLKAMREPKEPVVSFTKEEDEAIVREFAHIKNFPNTMVQMQTLSKFNTEKSFRDCRDRYRVLQRNQTSNIDVVDQKDWSAEDRIKLLAQHFAKRTLSLPGRTLDECQAKLDMILHPHQYIGDKKNTTVSKIMARHQYKVFGPNRLQQLGELVQIPNKNTVRQLIMSSANVWNFVEIGTASDIVAVDELLHDNVVEDETVVDYRLQSRSRHARQWSIAEIIEVSDFIKAQNVSCTSQINTAAWEELGQKLQRSVKSLRFKFKQYFDANGERLHDAPKQGKFTKAEDLIVIEHWKRTGEFIATEDCKRLSLRRHPSQVNARLKALAQKFLQGNGDVEMMLKAGFTAEDCTTLLR